MMKKALLALTLLTGCAVGGADVGAPAVASTSASLTSGGMTIAPATGWGDVGVTGTARADGSVDWCCTTWIVQLPVQAGDVIGTVTIPVRDNGADNGHPTGGNTITATVGTADGSMFSVLQYFTTAGTGDQTTVTLTFSPPHVVVANENLQLRLLAQTPSLFGGTAATNLSWVGTIRATGPVHTLIVPVLPPKVASVVVAQWASIGGQGSASHWSYVPLSFAVGTTIMALRARVEDAGSGTTLRERLLSMSDSTETFSVVATSPSSSGTGADETLAIPGPIVTAPVTQYVVEVGNAANPSNLDSKLFRLEVDVE